ncbi:MAG: KAP family NTPase [Mediterranea sp.]|jgi:hypothetical protein|nr:KAP family NTPase [Mediterranea sp.]
MEENIVYPHFLSSKPCGEDWFEGKSQDRLSEALAAHIINTDKDKRNQLPRIIGLEGGWGAGKSNVIYQLKEKLKEDYYFFEYDAWGHQEDLQRRSFLESLTSTLLTDKILEGKASIKIKGGGTKDGTWEEKLKLLLARKTETTTEKYPRLSIPIIVSALVILITPLFTFIASEIKLPQWLTALLPFVPIILALLLWFVGMRRNKEYRKLKNLFVLFSDKVENDICYETISEEEPSVCEFKGWMQSISDYIEKEGKRKLVVVYDNMDRLPSEKVKELWSSIYTFFSEGGFANIWAIIPYDRKHLACAFGEASDKQELNTYFINKTFPIIYRVTPPVMTDFKSIFARLYKEAFGTTESEYQEMVNRIFRLEKPNSTVRDMIIFINQLVELKSIWKTSIDIVSMAIFIIKKGCFEDDDPVKAILDKKYSDEILSKIIHNDESLQKTMPALFYGILPDDAEQIPITRYIEQSLKGENGEYNINNYCNYNHFTTVLNEVITNTDIPVDNLINGLFKLNKEFVKENSVIITPLWNLLAERKMKHTLDKQDISIEFKHLIECTSEEYKRRIVAFLYKQIVSFKDCNGIEYYHALSDLNDCAVNNGIELDIQQSEQEPKVFVDYVIAAKEDYVKYKMVANPQKLDKYFASMLPNDIIGHEALYYLANDETYKFDTLISKIEATIKDDTQGKVVNAQNFKSILDTYKIISKIDPLPVQLNQTQRNNIWNGTASKVNTAEFIEILLIQNLNGSNNGGSFDESQIKYAANTLHYYTNYGEALIHNLSWNLPILKQVLKYITEHKMDGKLDLSTLLPKFFEIRNNLQVTEECLLSQLGRWKINDEIINKGNIQTIIPNATFYQYSSANKNTMTNFINKVAVDALTSIAESTLYNQRAQLNNNYWWIVINNLIDTEYLKSLPDNLTDFGKRILDDIAGQKQTLPVSSLFQTIIDKMDKRKTFTHIKDIRDKYLIGQYNMTPVVFLYLHSWLEQQGDLIKEAKRVVHRIVEPVVDNAECLNVILSNNELYSEIVNIAEDDAYALKDKIRKKVKANPDERLVIFATKIGLEDGTEQMS